MNKEKRIELFLEELTKLTAKYDLVIDGCGHCGSPFLADKADYTGTHYEIKYSISIFWGK